MGKLTNSLKQAADHAERLAGALNSLPQGAEFPSGGLGGGGGGGAIVPPVVFNTTIISRPGPSRPGSGGGGGGGGGGIAQNDLQARAFSYFGLSSVGKSSAFVKQIVDEFLRIVNKGHLAIRTGGVG